MASTESLPPYPYSEADLPPPSYDVGAAKQAIADLPPEKVAAFNRGVAEALSDARVQPYLLQAARDAVTSVEAIENMFTHLTQRLIKIDNMKLNGDKDPFEPQLAAIKKVGGIILFAPFLGG
jgi:hypothetical protein